MTTISPARQPEAPVEARLKPVLYTVFAAKFLIAALLITAVNVPVPDAHARHGIELSDF